MVTSVSIVYETAGEWCNIHEVQNGNKSCRHCLPVRKIKATDMVFDVENNTKYE